MRVSLQNDHSSRQDRATIGATSLHLYRVLRGIFVVMSLVLLHYFYFRRQPLLASRSGRRRVQMN